MDDMDLDLEEMEEEEEGIERQNRTFVLLVAVMGGLLLIGIVAFCAWVLIVGRGMISGGQAAAVPTLSPTAITAPGETATFEAEEAAAMAGTSAPTEAPPSPTPTATPRPTRTPSPAPTPTPRADRSPTPSPEATRQGTPAAAAEVTPTIGPPRAQTPAAPTATAAATTSPQTGLGGFTAVVVAAGLLALLFVARRLRTAH